MVAWPENESTSWSTAMKEFVDVAHSSTGVHAAGTLSAFATITFTRDVTATSGDVAYTGVGFTPRQIVFICSLALNDNFSWGFDDGAAAYCTSQTEVGGSAASGLSIILRPTAGTQQSAMVKSLDSDGFTLTWAKSGTPPAGTATIIALCLK